MAESFASVAQYEARYGGVEDDALLQECLDDATAAIRAALDRSGIDPAARGEGYADRLMRVCRSMANRIMPSGDSEFPQGITQSSITAGSYNQQWTFGSTYGTPKLLDSERALLGLGAPYIGSIRAVTAND